MKTPIVFAMDDGYAMPTAVAIKSLLNHYSGDNIEIFILHKGELKSISKVLLKEAVFSFPSNVSLQFIDVGNRMNNASSHIAHISAVTYYRILLPELLSDYDQCLYLDGDIIVNQDIKPLCDTYLQSDEYIAGVPTVMIQTARRSVQEQRKQLLNIDDFSDYVNAGVILMNLKALRDNNCIDRMMDMVTYNYPLQDQDILNVISYKKTRILPPKYNAMPRILRNERIVYKVFSAQDINEAQTNPIIIHYADKRKPWKYVNLPQGEKWRDVYHELFSMFEIDYLRFGNIDRVKDILLKVQRRLKK